MPVKRRLSPRVFGPLEREHLETGPSHLLAGICGLCERGDAAAKAAWTMHRIATITSWARRVPFPCWGAIMFDGKTLPSLNPSWPRFPQLMHKLLRESLDAVKGDPGCAATAAKRAVEQSQRPRWMLRTSPRAWTRWRRA